MALLRSSGGAPAFPDLGILGGNISGVVVVPSDALTNKAILLDAAQAVVDVGPIIPSKSTQAALQLSDTPTDGATSLVSLWQTNSVAIKLERWWGFALLSSSAAVTITGLAIDQGTGT